MIKIQGTSLNSSVVVQTPEHDGKTEAIFAFVHVNEAVSGGKPHAGKDVKIV